jgi:hypothetical protein
LEEESRRERAQLIPIQILERLGEIVPEISDLVKICGDRDTSFGFLKAAAADNSRRPRGAYTGGAGDGMAQKLADWLGALSLN